MYIGLDVSKLTFDLGYRTEKQGKKRSKSGEHHKKFPYTLAGIDEANEWTRKRHPGVTPIYVLEATGPYHLLAATVLGSLGNGVCVVNPEGPSSLRKGKGGRIKTDKRDSLLLHDYGVKFTPRLWVPTPNPMLELRALIKRLLTIKDQQRGERLRLSENQRVTSIVSVSYSLLRSLAYLASEQTALEQEIEAFYAAHPDYAADRELLQTIPGVGPQAADYLLWLLKDRGLTDAGEAVALAGIIPVLWESGTSVHGVVHISRAGDRHVRSGLYLPALSASRHNARLKAFYESLLARGKSKKSAIIAVMHRMIRIAYGVLTHQRAYDPHYLEARAAANPVPIAAEPVVSAHVEPEPAAELRRARPLPTVPRKRSRLRRPRRRRLTAADCATPPNPSPPAWMRRTGS